MPALELAVMLARPTGEDVVVAVVVAAAWPPSTERVDADYRAYLKEHGEQSLEQAKAWMPAEVKTRFVLHHSPRSRRGCWRSSRTTTPVFWSWVRPTAADWVTSPWGVSRTASCTAHQSRRLGSAGIRGRAREPRSPCHGCVRWHSEGPGRRPDRGRVLRLHGKLLAYRVVLSAAQDAVRRDPGGRRRGPGGRRVVPADARGHRRPARGDWQVTGAARPPAVVTGDGYGWCEAMAKACWSPGDLLVVDSSSHPARLRA